MKAVLWLAATLTLMASCSVSQDETGSPFNTNEKVMISLMGDIEAYNGTTHQKIEIQGELTDASWMHSSFSDFGLYLPKQLKSVRLSKEGHEFQYASDPFSTIEIVDFEPIDTLTAEENLSIYEEYLGSTTHPSQIPGHTEQDATRYDYFEVSYGDVKGYVRFKYPIRSMKEVIPIFLDIIKYVQYEDENSAVYPS